MTHTLQLTFTKQECANTIQIEYHKRHWFAPPAPLLKLMQSNEPTPSSTGASPEFSRRVYGTQGYNAIRRYLYRVNSRYQKVAPPRRAFMTFIAAAIEKAGANCRNFDRGELQGGLNNGHKACILDHPCN